MIKFANTIIQISGKIEPFSFGHDKLVLGLLVLRTIEMLKGRTNNQYIFLLFDRDIFRNSSLLALFGIFVTDNIGYQTY